MREIFNLKSFWMVLALSVGVIFVALLNFNRVYSSQTQVLIIPKGAAAENGRQVVENFKAMVESTSFFSRMIEKNPGIVDSSVLEMTPNKKKDYWNSHLKVEQSGKSGILSITLTNKDRYRAETLASQTSKSLVETASFFYNIKTDVDIRIIDGPITGTALSWPVTVLILESLAIGFVLGLFSFSASFLVFEGKKKDIKKDFNLQSKSVWKKESNILRGPSVFTKEKPWVFKKEEAAKPEVFYRPGKKAAAPDNLPVAPESGKKSSEVSQESAKETKKVELKIEEKPIIREATPEEVKERLNRLLSGKF